MYTTIHLRARPRTVQHGTNHSRLGVFGDYVTSPLRELQSFANMSTGGGVECSWEGRTSLMDRGFYPARFQAPLLVSSAREPLQMNVTKNIPDTVTAPSAIAMNSSQEFQLTISSVADRVS